MNIIVCLDDNNGMLFHNRRQSRDKMLVEDLKTMTEMVWISPFSEKLFMDTGVNTKVDENLLEKAGKEEYCFVENKKISPHINQVEKLIVYKWNRKYPADLKFDVSLEGWTMREQKEFAGSSHEKITRETYVRG